MSCSIFKSIREKYSFSKKKISDLLGLKNVQVYNKKGNGVIPFTQSETKVFAEFFGCSADELLNESKNAT